MNDCGISKLDLKRRNRMQILKVVREQGPISRVDISAILDRLPTAKVVEQNGRTSIIEAEVNHGRGIIMYLLSQGAWVKVLSPQSLVDEMQEELHQMLALYEKA